MSLSMRNEVATSAAVATGQFMMVGDGGTRHKTVAGVGQPRIEFRGRSASGISNLVPTSNGMQAFLTFGVLLHFPSTMLSRDNT